MFCQSFTQLVASRGLSDANPACLTPAAMTNSQQQRRNATKQSTVGAASFAARIYKNLSSHCSFHIEARSFLCIAPLCIRAIGSKTTADVNLQVMPKDLKCQESNPAVHVVPEFMLAPLSPVSLSNVSVPKKYTAAQCFYRVIFLGHKDATRGSWPY